MLVASVKPTLQLVPESSALGSSTMLVDVKISVVASLALPALLLLVAAAAALVDVDVMLACAVVASDLVVAGAPLATNAFYLRTSFHAGCPGAVGKDLLRGTWHGVLAPLHAPGLFAVVDRIGPTPNLEEHRYTEPWTVLAP